MIIHRTRPELIELRTEVRRLRRVLRFYARPETYFAIGFLPDPPCGDFIADFDDTEFGQKPGKRARAALRRRRP